MDDHARLTLFLSRDSAKVKVLRVVTSQVCLLFEITWLCAQVCLYASAEMRQRGESHVSADALCSQLGIVAVEADECGVWESCSHLLEGKADDDGRVETYTKLQ